LSAQDTILTLVGILVLGIIVVLANYADQHHNLRARAAVRGLLILGNVLLVINGIGQVMSAYSPNLQSGTPPGKVDAWGALILSIVVAGLATAVLSPAVAERIAVLFPRYRGKAEIQPAAPSAFEPDQPESLPADEPLFPQMLNYYTTDALMVPRAEPATPVGKIDVESDQRADWVRGFNPASTVHVVAVVYVLYLVGSQFISFILGGGLSGVAQSYQTQGLSGWSLILSELPFLVIPVLGVGLGLHRNLGQTLKRLGLKLPVGQGVLAAFGVTIGLFIFVAIVNSVWMALVPKDVYQQQTQASDALSNSVTSIGLAFLLAASAAVGEEIAFRGALQPVLGFWPTAIIFAMTHIQYALTPAWLIILGVALAFGWLRMRYSTTVSMMTHFLYNFIPLALTVGVPQGAWIWVLKLALT
jgi:membrane protease YdiL (CAAX protease family)